MTCSMFSSDRDYWKRYFDDENRNKVREWQPMSTKTHPYLKRGGDPIENNKIDFLTREVGTYKKLLKQEKQYRDKLIMDLHRLQSENKIMKMKLIRIKKDVFNCY